MKQACLPEDVQQVLRSARALDAVPDASRDRLASRLEASLGIAALGSMSAAAARTAGKVAAKGALASTLGGKVVVAFVAFSLGGAAGALGHAALTREPRVHEARVPRAPVAVAPPAEVPVVPAALAIPAPAAPPPRHRAPRVTSPSPDPLAELAEGPSSLARESQVLDDARAALARRDLGAAREAIAAHEAAFPLGRLNEEREALSIRLLSASGDVEAARGSAAAFLERYPNSVSRPAVEALLE